MKGVGGCVIQMVCMSIWLHIQWNIPLAPFTRGILLLAFPNNLPIFVALSKKIVSL